MSTVPHDLRQRIVRIVLDSAEGDLTETDLSAAGWSLAGVGYSSLSYIRMVDAIENNLGVYLDSDHLDEQLDSVDKLVELTEQQMKEASHA